MKAPKRRDATGAGVSLGFGILTGAQMMLVHMDEKWFFCAVARKNDKTVPHCGVCPVQHHAHHKSHIGKVMCIATTGCLPFNNNMQKNGGLAVKTGTWRAGKELPARKDMHSRIHRDDGTHCCPCTPENRLRVAGQKHFQSMEITRPKSAGQNDETPKHSLMEHCHKCEPPAMEKQCQTMENKTGKKAVVRCQLDGAGPHQDADFIEWLRDEFDNRGWMLACMSTTKQSTR